MERLYKSSEKMKAAQSKALDRLKAMSFEDLMALSDKNQGGSTAAFLESLNMDAQHYCNAEWENADTAPAERSSPVIRAQTYSVYIHKELSEYVVASPRFRVGTTIHTQKRGRLEAALLSCGQALSNFLPVCPSSFQDEELSMAAA
ncbi:hypothetical protein [Pseudomonas fulva]|uniref:hypothetical protein n=1 Tax=Pseudomonas fulva TaxID=47880 RepID=UPI0012F51014|nr:hypothetical protein [Pseudomonas fulva]